MSKQKIILVPLVALMMISVGFLSGCTEEQNKSPTVEIFADPMTGYQPLEVSFTIIAEDTDGLVQSCEIDFGDGTTSFETNPNHIYQAGTYNVIITVIDNEGAITSETITIVVKNKLPSVSASSDITTGKEPLLVFFTSSANDSDGTINSYEWDFKDGETSSLQNTNHTFQSSGNYTVIITVTDNDGGIATDSIMIIVLENDPPTASISASPTSGVNPLEIKFLGSGTDSDGTIDSYHWDFDDVTDSDEQYPSKTFLDPGVYTVVLTVTDDKGATGTATVEITVSENSPPTASVSADPTFGYCPFTVQFIGSGTDEDGSIDSYYWDFGDGDDTGSQNPSHTYNSPGTYTVTLTVTDDKGLTDIDTITITAYRKTSFSLIPTDDSIVHANHPDNNTGSEPGYLEYLGVAQNPYGSIHGPFEISYLKFDLSDIPSSSTIKSAYLEVYLEYVIIVYPDPDPCVRILRSMDVSWSENTITWNNKPSYSYSVYDDVEILNDADEDTYIRFELKDHVNNALSDGRVTFVMDTCSSEDVGVFLGFRSKEHSNQPKLIVEIY